MAEQYDGTTQRGPADFASRPLLTSACLAAALMLAAAQLSAQEPSPADKQQIEAALKLTTSEAAKYQFVLDDGERTEGKLLPEPVLRWSNPAAGEIYGNVFLWTVDTRPLVVGSLFKWFSPHTHMSHEFHSLAEKPVRGSYAGGEIWRTSAAGVAFAPVPSAPTPAVSAPQRLVQMRRLARDFSVTKRDRDGSIGELRLLTQPIYRYAAPQAGISDGALFTFVQGTDPELSLLLEARTDNDGIRWMYAAARMNSVAFTLRHGEREVWKVDILPWAEIQGRRHIYTTFRHENVPLP